MPPSHTQVKSGEQHLLDSLSAYLETRPVGRYRVTVGDDAAVRVGGAGESLVFTTDALVEGVHFSLEYMSLSEVGHKAMAANLSDCAAMGADADGVLVELVIPSSCRRPATEVKHLYRGMSFLGRKHGAHIVGGNVSRGPCWMLSLTVIGRMPPGTRPFRRDRFRPGDELWVTGTLGASAAGLATLQRWGRTRVPPGFGGLVAAHVKPQPRLAAASVLRAQGSVIAAIDITDGLATDCARIAHASGVCVVLNPGTVPVLPSVRKLAVRIGVDPMEWVLHGGEDYELLFACRPGGFSPGTLERGSVRCTRIGRVRQAPGGVWWQTTQGLEAVEARGWDHLS